MAEIRSCPECGVPEQITANYLWLSSGAMVQSNNPSRRVGFIESENLDPLYRGIGDIIGAPIDHLVIDIARRGTASYFASLLPAEARGGQGKSLLGGDVVAAFMVAMGQLNGFGRCEILDIRYEGSGEDRTVMRVSEPFSVLLVAGAQAGGCEVVSGRPHTAAYAEVSPGVYEITAAVSEHGEELEKRMRIEEYRHREGDVDLERCATCGGPAALSGFKWILDRGLIVNGWTKRRMVMMGPEAQDPLFKELEAELGETIPTVVVEAQRRFVKSGFYSIDDISDEGDLRTQLALRGMGNLREISMGEKGMRMRIDNAANYLMTVGLAQGLFEMAFNVDSHAEWEASERGDLSLEVAPQRTLKSVP